MIIVNTKNYKTSNELLKLAKLIETHDLHILIAVPATDIYPISAKTTLNVYAQHTDYVKDEKTTGHTSAQSARASGASGTLLNHSEHKLTLDVLKKTIEQCNKAHLVTVVCASTLAEAKSILQFKPSLIAFEDPALISTGKSITSSKKHDIIKFVSLLKNKPTIPICGAGISSIEDVKQAYALGCKGCLISSAIANAPEHKVASFLSDIHDFFREK